MFTKIVDAQANHFMVVFEFASPIPAAGPKRYMTPLHFLDDVNTAEVVLEQLASLPLEEE